MVSLGLIACLQSFSSAYCIIKLIECIISIVMIIWVCMILIVRLRKSCRLNFYGIVSIAMLLTLIFIVAYSVDSSIVIFNFLYLYFYNAYFSIIVFKLAQKVLQKYKQSIYFKYFGYARIIIFVVYSVLVLAALIYRIIQSQSSCLQHPFLIANSFSFTAALFFLCIGIKHIKWQQERIDQNLSNDQQNNPLPRFRIWISLNCLAQLMVLVQSIIFQVNDCVFSSNEVTNQVMNLIFVFSCFHIGILATVYFFRHSAPEIQDSGMVRTKTMTSNSPKIEIELAYRGADEIRTKMVSQ